MNNDEYSLQDSYDQLVYENLKLNKTMNKIDHYLKEKDENHLDISSQLLNVILKGDIVMKDLKLRIENRIKSLQIIIWNNEKYLTCNHDLEKSIL